MFGSTGNDTFLIGQTGGNDTIIGGGGNDALAIYGKTESDGTYTQNQDGSTTITFSEVEEARHPRSRFRVSTRSSMAITPVTDSPDRLSGTGSRSRSRDIRLNRGGLRPPLFHSGEH